MHKNLIEDSNGRFGKFGGCFAPELLQGVLAKVRAGFDSFLGNKALRDEFDDLLKHFAGRPTPLFHAKKLSEKLGGAQIYLKREDLLHGGAHKTNNVIGQA